MYCYIYIRLYIASAAQVPLKKNYASCIHKGELKNGNKNFEYNSL